MKYLSKIILILFASLTLAGCNPVSVDRSPETIGDLYNFDKKLVKGGDFWITTYQKITNKNQPYVFYIEGDGSAFAGRYQVSHNPTPRRQMLIKLAMKDPRPNVIYVARPCQYTAMDLNPKCSNAYWTDKRLSDDSVESMNQVINSINNNRQKFSLVGFSGGGGIAVLIAERNDMVKDIITIAGNLDHKAFTQYHNVTPMLGSLNPIDYAKKINDIPQLHISGGRDKTIPPFIADKYVQESNSRCVKQLIFEENMHNKGWENFWEYILTLPVTCYD